MTGIAKKKAATKRIGGDAPCDSQMDPALVETELSIAFAGTVKSYASNLQDLRDFLALLTPFLKRQQWRLMKRSAPALAPLAVAFAELFPKGLSQAEHPPDEALWDKDALNWIRDEYSVDLEVEECEDGSRGVRFSVSGPKQDAFNTAMHTLMRASQHETLLYWSALISLVSTTEWFFAQMVHTYLRCHPGALGKDEKQFSLEDLDTFETIADAQDSLIEKKTEALLKADFQAWVKFLKENPKLSMSYLDKLVPEIAEVFQRRNGVIHNRGITDSIYMAKVLPRLRKQLKLGDRLIVDQKYLDKAMQLLERSFLLMAAELWKKLKPSDEERGAALIDIAFEHLSSENWEIAAGLSRFTMADAGLPEKDRLTGKVNYWQAMKWAGKFTEIAQEVADADFSAKEERFQLAIHAVRSDKKQFFELLPSVLRAKQLDRKDLDEWPLFREMRKTRAYKAFYKEYFPPKEPKTAREPKKHKKKEKKKPKPAP